MDKFTCSTSVLLRRQKNCEFRGAAIHWLLAAGEATPRRLTVCDATHQIIDKVVVVRHVSCGGVWRTTTRLYWNTWR